MERTHLYRKVRSLGINVEEMREEARRTAPMPPAGVGYAKPTRPVLAEIETSDENSIDNPTGSTLDRYPLLKEARSHQAGLFLSRHHEDPHYRSGPHW